jgi:hypothetical protein
MPASPRVPTIRFHAANVSAGREHCGGCQPATQASPVQNSSSRGIAMSSEPERHSLALNLRVLMMS